MGSGGARKSLGRLNLMFLIRRKTGNVRADRVRKTRALPILLTALLATTDASAQSPLGSYCFNEAGSGTGPTTILDDQPSPVNLSVTFFSMGCSGAGIAGRLHRQD